MFEEKRPVSQQGTPPNGEFGGDNGHGSRDLQRRARELEIVAQVASEAATELDVNRLLWSVANLTKERFALYHAHIYLLDAGGENLTLKAGAGEIGEQMVAEGRVISIHHPHSLVASAARSRQGILSNDVTQTVDFLPHPLLPETRSELAVPMIARGELVGVLDVQAERINAFDDEDVRLKAVLAAQVAIAVQNAQTFERMERTQEAYARVYDNSIDLIGTAGLSDGFFKSLNPAWEVTLGWTVDELMAQPYVTFVHPDDVEATNREAGEQLGRGLKTISFQNRYRTRDGAYRWLAWNSTPDIPNDLIYFVARDITEQKLAQAALDDRSKELADIKFALDEHAIVAITDQTGKITYVNDKFTQISEYSPQELLGQDHRIINSGYHSKEFIRNVWVTIANGGVWKGEFLNRAKSGRLYWVDTTIVPFLNAQGKPYQYVAIRYDITSRKQAEETVQRHALEMETVAEVSAATSTILNTEHLLQSVVDLTKERFDLYHAHIYLLNEQADMLVLAAGAGSAGRTMVERRHTIPFNREHSLVARAARSRIPVVVNDVTQTPDFLPNALLPNTKSEMAIPMIVGDTLIGVLDVQSEQLGRFASDDQQVHGALAAQIAVAVQNARQYQLAQQRLRFTQASNRISELARAESDLETTLTQILEEVVTVFGADTSVFSLLNRSDGRWHGFVGAGGSMTSAIAKTFVDDAERYPHAVEALQQGDVVAIDDSQQYPKFPADYIELVGIKSVLTLPISAAEDMTGAIFINYGSKYHTFTVDEIDLARGFVNQITATIQRRLAEQQVQLYADVAANSPIGIYVYRLENLNDDRSLRLMAANPASEAATGVKPETIIGKTMSEAFPGLMETQVPTIYANVVRTAQIVELGEIEYGDENVQNAVFYVRAFPLPNQSVGISFENITERKRQQEALRASEEQLQSILDNATAVVYVKGRDGRYITVNRTYERLFHVRREDMLGKTDYDIFPKEAADAFRAVDIQVWEEGKTLELEEHAPTDDGLRTYISVKFPLRDSKGEVYAMCGISTDITERIQQENALRASEERFRSIAATMPGAVYQFTAQGEVWKMTYISPAIEMIAGVSAESVMQDINALVGLFHPDDLQPFVNSVVAVLQSNTPWHFEGRLVRPDGSLRWWDASSQPITLPDGTVVFNGVLFDITERKLAENEIAARSRDIETVAQVGTRIASTLDVQELLWAVTNLTKENFNRYHAHIYLLDDAGQNLVLSAGAGEVGRQLVARGHSIPLDRPNSLVARAARSRQVTVVNAVRQDPDFLPNDLLPETRAEMAVPILYGDQLLGVLDIQDRVENAFNATNEQVKQALANQIAVALVNARTFEQMQIAQADFTRIFDSSIDLIGTAGLTDGTFKSLNPAWEVTLGWTLEELMSKPYIEFTHPDDVERTNREASEQLGKGYKTLSFENRYITRDGDYRWLSWNSTPDVENSLIYFVARDVTEQKLSETIIRQARTRAELLASTNANLSQAADEQAILSAIMPLLAENPPALASFMYADAREDEHIEALHVVALASGDGQPLPLTMLPTLDYSRAEFPLVSLLVAGGNELLVVDDFTTDDRIGENLMRYIEQLGLGAAIIIPFRSGGTWQGLMAFNWNSPQQFSDEMQALLSAALPTANAVIASRRAYVAEEQARRGSELLYTASDRLNRAQSYEEVLQSLLGTTLLYEFDRASIILFDQPWNASTSGIVAAVWEKDGRVPRAPKGTIYPVSAFPFLTLMHQDEPLIVRDADSDVYGDENLKQILQSLQMRSVVFYPLVVKGAWIGILTAQSAGALVLSEDGIRQLTTLVGQASNLIQNTMLFEQTQAARGRAELLAAINANLSQAADEQAILSAIMPLLAENPPALASFMYADAREDEHIEALHVVALASGGGQPLPLTMLPTLDYSRAEFPLVNLLVGTGNELLVVGDFTTDDRIGENLMRYIEQLGLGAAIIIPFRSGGTWQGLMAFNWNSPQQFSDEMQALLSAALPTANAVIASRRAYVAEEQARRETELLYTVTNRLAEATSRDQLLEAISSYAHTLDADNAILLYLENDAAGDAQWAEVVAGWNKDDMATAQVGQRFNLAQFPFAHVWLSSPNTANLIGDIANTPHLDANTKARYLHGHVQATAILPMYVQGRWVGIAVMAWRNPVKFSAEDQRIFTAIAQQAAPAVDAVRLFETTTKRAAELETVARVSTATTTILDLEQLLQSVSDLTKESFNLYHAHIYLYDPERQLLVLAAGAGEAGRVMKERGHSIPYQRQTSVVATAARTRQAVLVNDVTEEPNFMPNPLLSNTRSELAVPLVVGDELIGVLDVQSEQIGRFTQADALIKGTLAGQIAVAVNNARAFEHEQQTVQQLRELDRLKQQFLANMSHELRTPLNSIIGYSEVLLDGVDGDLTDDAVEDVNAIHMSGKHLLAIINDILDLAKIEAGQMYLERKPVELEGFLSELVRTNQILVKDKPVELLLERVDASVTDVHADPIRLRQIMMNLVSNAVKFTEQGSVTVRFGQADDHQAYIEVQDTGIGIKEEDLPVIFEQFRQVDGSSTRRAGGTGLGLTITRHFITMHGGDISAESEYGVGTKMRFTLPLHDSVAV